MAVATDRPVPALIALRTIMEVRQILGGAAQLRMPAPESRQMADEILWAFTCHPNARVAHAASRVRSQFSLSAYGPADRGHLDPRSAA
jgi:hypothetical protein